MQNAPAKQGALFITVRRYGDSVASFAVVCGTMNGVVGAFFAKRERMVAELNDTGHGLDEWYAEHQHGEPSLHDLALLEGLLAKRRIQLEALLQLDDDMMVQLLKERGSGSP